MGHAIQYRFKAGKGARYTVVFGLCEGYHAKPGQRILTLQIEGKSLRTVDLVAEKGRNQPEVFSFPARDENGDGWIDLAVAAAENSPDKNTILNTLWVFPRSGRCRRRKNCWPAGARSRRWLTSTAAPTQPEQTAAPRPGARPAAQYRRQPRARRAHPDDRERLPHQAGCVPPTRADRRVDQPDLLRAPSSAWRRAGAGRCCRFPETVIPPHGEQALSFVVARGRNAARFAG